MLNRLKSSFVLKFVALLFLCGALASCGYSIVRGEKGIYQGEVVSIDVPVFKNQSFESQIPQFFTEAFTREMIVSGIFEVNKEGSSSILQGTIMTTRIIPTAMNSNGLTIQKTIYVTIGLALSSKDGRLVKNWSLIDAETYDVQDINLEEPNKRQALIRVAGRMSRRFSALILADIDRKAL